MHNIKQCFFSLVNLISNILNMLWIHINVKLMSALNFKRQKNKNDYYIHIFVYSYITRFYQSSIFLSKGTFHQENDSDHVVYIYQFLLMSFSAHVIAFIYRAHLWIIIASRRFPGNHVRRHINRNFLQQDFELIVT